jgi:hypothetical protein
MFYIIISSVYTVLVVFFCTKHYFCELTFFVKSYSKNIFFICIHIGFFLLLYISYLTFLFPFYFCLSKFLYCIFLYIVLYASFFFSLIKSLFKKNVIRVKRREIQTLHCSKWFTFFNAYSAQVFI